MVHFPPYDAQREVSVRVVPREFEFTYLILDETGPDDLKCYVKQYPSQAELQDDLRTAGLPVSLSMVGHHGPIDATDHQLQLFRRAADQDYR